MKHRTLLAAIALYAFAAALSCTEARAQELEPRAYSASPVGTLPSAFCVRSGCTALWET